MSEDPSPPGLHWSIKRSFVLYVARMADGQILGSKGVQMTDASTFLWAPTAFRQEPAALQMEFGGAVTFGAHAGALSFRVADPHVDLKPGRSLMTVAGESAVRVPFVDFHAEEQPTDETSGALRRWVGTDVRLAEEALAMFAGYYGAGESFDDLEIVLPWT